MVSIACKGLNCSNIISNIPRNSYGHNSVFARMLDINTKCLSIGLGPNWTPFIHYLDYLVSSEFRYDKLFYGKIKLKDSIIKETKKRVEFLSKTIINWIENTFKQFFKYYFKS